MIVSTVHILFLAEKKHLLNVAESIFKSLKSLQRNHNSIFLSPWSVLSIIILPLCTVKIARECQCVIRSR